MSDGRRLRDGYRPAPGPANPGPMIPPPSWSRGTAGPAGIDREGLEAIAEAVRAAITALQALDAILGKHLHRGPSA